MCLEAVVDELRNEVLAPPSPEPRAVGKFWCPRNHLRVLNKESKEVAGARPHGHLCLQRLLSGRRRQIITNAFAAHLFPSSLEIEGV